MLTDDERLFTAAGCAFLEDGIIPCRRPGYQAPDFWTLPVAETRFPTVPSSVQWQDLIRLQPPAYYQMVVDQWIATTLTGPPPAAGLAFRFLFDEGRPFGSQLDARVNRHRDPARWPFRKQRVVLPVASSVDTILLQVLNTTGGPLQLIAALFGWQYYSPESGAERGGAEEAVQDA